jgi:hypothetical protein
MTLYQKVGELEGVYVMFNSGDGFSLDIHIREEIIM